jgi:hypothetical protein
MSDHLAGRDGSPDGRGGAPLAAALAAIADGAARAQEAREADGRGLALGQVRASAARRRARFGTGVGLAAAGVVAALVLGGAALARLDRPVPPAVTETPEDGVACGTRLADLPRPADGPVARVDLALDATAVTPGQTVAGTVTLDADETVDLDAGYPIQLALVRDGVVVGLASQVWTTSQAVRDVAMPLVACGPVDAAGGYGVAAVVAGLVLTSGEDWPYVLVSDPVPVALDGPAVGADLPGCGEPADALAPSIATLSTTASVQVGVLDAQTGEFLHEGYGDALNVLVGLVNDGPDLFGVRDLRLEMLVAQDGVVVASWAADAADLAREWPVSAEPDPLVGDWPALDGRPAPWTGQVSRCGAGAGGDLGPGDYVLWVRASMSAADRPDGEPAPVVVVAPPVPFTVHGFEDPDNHGPETFLADVDPGWYDVDPAEVPGDVPFTVDPGDEVIQAQASVDGRRWRVMVTYPRGRGTYERLRDGAVAAGFEVVREESDPDRPAWDHAQLRRDDLLVALDLSNESGGGFVAYWLVVRDA